MQEVIMRSKEINAYKQACKIKCTIEIALFSKYLFIEY